MESNAMSQQRTISKVAVNAQQIAQPAQSENEVIFEFIHEIKQQEAAKVASKLGAQPAVRLGDFVMQELMQPQLEKRQFELTAHDTSTEGLKEPALAERPDKADEAIEVLVDEIQARWRRRMGFDSPESPVQLLRSNMDCEVAEAAAVLYHPDTLRRFPPVRLFAETLIPIGHSSRIHVLSSALHEHK
jgi:hypothetical protein